MKAFVAVCTLFFLIEVQALFECYYCTLGCDNPYIKQCNPLAGPMSCYSAVIAQPPSGILEYSRGCVLTNDADMITECSIINEMENSSCYFCDTTRCNDH